MHNFSDKKENARIQSEGGLFNPPNPYLYGPNTQLEYPNKVNRKN